jgi:hypothetical protein
VPLTGVGIGAGDFGIGADTSASASVTAGSTATYLVRVVGGAGFAGTVTFTCSGLPTGTACDNNPTGFVGPGGVEKTLSVATTAGTASLLGKPLVFSRSSVATSVCCLAAALGIIFLLLRKHRPQYLVLALLSLILLGTMVSCSGGHRGPTPAGTYSFTATATSGSTSRSTSLTLIVK